MEHGNVWYQRTCLVKNIWRTIQSFVRVSFRYQSKWKQCERYRENGSCKGLQYLIELNVSASKRLHHNGKLFLFTKYFSSSEFSVTRKNFCENSIHGNSALCCFHRIYKIFLPLQIVNWIDGTCFQMRVIFSTKHWKIFRLITYSFTNYLYLVKTLLSRNFRNYHTVQNFLFTCKFLESNVHRMIH